MASSKYKLGQLLRLCEERNEELRYGIDDVKGISIQKEFIETKADMEGVSLKPYYIVMPGSFAYVTVTSRNGEKITLAYNASQSTYIVSSSYIVFKIERKDIVLAEYLLMYFKRPEFDRYSRFNSWGSARETFSWQDMCDIDIELPPLPIQQKYVDIYNAMQENQRCYERGLDDLKLVCDGYVEDLRRRSPCVKIGVYIELCENKNDALLWGLDSVRGVSIEKKFIETKADMESVNLRPYYVIEPDAFAYVTVTSRNGEKISLAHNSSNEHYICSSSYVVFKVKDKNKLLPQFLRIFLSRSEFDRYARFNSWGSARETFNWEDMCDVEIPIPDITIQKAIADIYTAYTTRKEINERLKEQLKDLCPILIKGSLEEARKENPYGALHAASWNAQTH